MKIPKLIRNLAQPLPIYAFVKAASKSNGLFIYILPYNNVTQPDLTVCLEWLLLFFSMTDFQVAFSEPDV